MTQKRDIIRTLKYFDIDVVEADIIISSGILFVEDMRSSLPDHGAPGMTEESSIMFKEDLKAYVIEAAKERLGASEIEIIQQYGGVVSWFIGNDEVSIQASGPQCTP